MLLHECRAVFEAEDALRELGAVFGALSSLEAETGHREQAVDFKQTALRYSYRVGDPEDCAISQFHLANRLQHSTAPAEQALAHKGCETAFRPIKKKRWRL
jgi:hypothetical protein